MLGWIFAIAVLVKSTGKPSAILLSVYIFALLSTLYLLFESEEPSTTVVVQIQMTTFATLLICTCNNIFGIGAGLIFNSIIYCFACSNHAKGHAVKILKSQILADLCIVFALLILTIVCKKKATSDLNWILLAEVTFFVGILTKIASFVTNKSPLPSLSIFKHQGIFVIAVILFMRLEFLQLTSKHYEMVLLCLSNVGFVLFNIEALISNNIRKSIESLSLGTTSFILFLHCLNPSGAMNDVLLAYFFVQGGLLLLAETIIKIMSGEVDVNKMGGLRKYVIRTFTVSVLALVVANLMIRDSKVLSPLLSIPRCLQNDSFATFLVINYISFSVTYCIWAVRFAFFVFFGENRSDEQVLGHVKDVNWGMTISVVACIVCAPCIVCALTLLMGNWRYGNDMEPTATARNAIQRVIPSVTQIFTSGICSLCALLTHALGKRRIVTVETLLNNSFTENIKARFTKRSGYCMRNRLEQLEALTLKTVSNAYKKTQLHFFEKLYSANSTSIIISLLGFVILLLCFETLQSM
ncbi:MAG: hypothetical protein LBF66_02300 [Holosporales bacterium]|nr:hypothetical protein [Holosporales bacterium]